MHSRSFEKSRRNAPRANDGLTERVNTFILTSAFHVFMSVADEKVVDLAYRVPLDLEEIVVPGFSKSS